MNIQQNLQSCKWYFYCLLMMLIAGILLLISNGKSSCFIFLNSYHAYWLDVFFINYTFIGDGIVALVFAALLYFYFKRKQQGAAVLISFLIVGIVVQVLKNCMNSPRPKAYFGAGQYLHFIEGVSIANYASFPSGHTACAFAVATVLVLMSNKKFIQLPLLSISILVGYSRIYLGQHFLLDVIVGAMIGTASGIIGLHCATSMRPVKLFRYNKNRPKRISKLRGQEQLQYEV